VTKVAEFYHYIINKKDGASRGAHAAHTPRKRVRCGSACAARARP